MREFASSTPGRRTRLLLAVALATAGMVLLLSLWSGLPTAEARGPASADTGGQNWLVSASAPITIYLPILFKSDIVYFDDFASTSSDWYNPGTWPDPYDHCYTKYDTAAGVYHVRVTGNNERCIIFNGQVPPQVNGTFEVRVRRTSDNSYPVWYGFIFTGGNDLYRDRWALEAYPMSYQSGCSSSKPYFWLAALVNNSQKFFDDECTDAIDKDKNDWNELKVIRDGSKVKVYINGQLKGDYNYSNVPSVLNNGKFALQVVSGSSSQVRVEYDYVRIRRSTTP